MLKSTRSNLEQNRTADKYRQKCYKQEDEIRSHVLPNKAEKEKGRAWAGSGEGRATWPQLGWCQSDCEAFPTLANWNRKLPNGWNRGPTDQIRQELFPNWNCTGGSPIDPAPFLSKCNRNLTPGGSRTQSERPRPLSNVHVVRLVVGFILFTVPINM